MNTMAPMQMTAPTATFAVNGSPNATVPMAMAVIGSNTPSTAVLVPAFSEVLYEEYKGPGGQGVEGDGVCGEIFHLSGLVDNHQIAGVAECGQSGQDGSREIECGAFERIHQDEHADERGHY